MTDRIVPLQKKLRAFAYQLSRCSEITLGREDCSETSDELSQAADLLDQAEAALDVAAGRLAWIAKNEPGDRPDVIWRWENEARAALTAIRQSAQPEEANDGCAPPRPLERKL